MDDLSAAKAASGGGGEMRQDALRGRKTKGKSAIRLPAASGGSGIAARDSLAGSSACSRKSPARNLPAPLRGLIKAQVASPGTRLLVAGWHLPDPSSQLAPPLHTQKPVSPLIWPPERAARARNSARPPLPGAGASDRNPRAALGCCRRLTDKKLRRGVPHHR